MEGVMVSVATGVMNSLLDKLTALMGKEFKLHSRVKRDIAFLKDELSCMNALLEKLGNMEVLDLQVKEWRKQVQSKGVGSHHGVAQQINELKDRVVEAKHRRKRYKVANEVDPGTNNVLSIDPRLSALYVESSDLVGIDIPRDHLINMLDDGEQSLKKPDVKKILGVLLSQVKNQDCATTEIGDDNQLINALRSFLKNKRYFIVIDDIWNTQVWNAIKCALLENSCGSRILVTTRIATIAKSCCSPHNGTVYELRPLSEADSMSLFYKRIFGSEDLCPMNLKDVAADIIKRCGGLPLAIITMASLMITKSDGREEWMVSISNFQALRVLDLESSVKLQNCDLQGVGDLFHLRLCIRVKQVTQEVLNILGGLPSLLDLELRSEAVDEPMEMLSLRNISFDCLKIFRLYGPIMGLNV
ncbi:hypothetical protein HU200_013633 [Digitaria exilis]|uniref:NB-ARC domain-containing protein n=1 Tax=Digitaria exilis TaxID=1010633 RepID=A0A835KKX1_9POAL|nr:hypothetical protein HU200_013633 [Digitaria exilis]